MCGWPCHARGKPPHPRPSLEDASSTAGESASGSGYDLTVTSPEVLRRDCLAIEDVGDDGQAVERRRKVGKDLAREGRSRHDLEADVRAIDDAVLARPVRAVAVRPHRREAPGPEVPEVLCEV